MNPTHRPESHHRRLFALSATALAAAATLGLAACGGSSSSTETAVVAAAPLVDPVLGTWKVALGGRYARVLETRTSAPTSTWPALANLDTSGGQLLPSYSDVQQVSYSADWVYIVAAGLASHQMGPWYWDVNNLFGNWARSQAYTFSIPRKPVEALPSERVAAGLGPQGAWVNGVPLFNQLDGFSYNIALDADGQSGPPSPTFGSSTDRVWIRDAIPVEGPSFDASNAHQPPNGQYHYHSNPLALRFQLGDNVEWSATSARYVETSAAKKHSPILGWAQDGYPIYGPYGYSDCTSTATATAVTRMRSGYLLRDGNNGTTNLATAGRKTIGKWAAEMHKFTVTGLDSAGRFTLPATSAGPAISTRFALGRYNEDYEFRGDMGQAPGQNYDLDMFNGRTCRTPDYPNGTYAYYVTISDTGAPAYPYTIGRQFRGKPTGSTGNSVITEAVTVQAVSPAVAPQTTVASVTGGRKVTWSSAEGTTYRLEASTDGKSSWTTVSDGVRAATPGSDATPGGIGAFALTALQASVVDGRVYAAEPSYRVVATAVAANATAVLTAAYAARVIALSPATASPGQTIRVKVEVRGNQPLTDLGADAAKPVSVQLMTTDGLTVIATGSNFSRVLGTTEADMTIPASAPVGNYMVRLNFGRNVFNSANQTVGLAAALIAPAPEVYPNLTISVR